MTKQDIIRAQTALAGLGLYKSTIDGINGRGTKNAIRRFQVMHNLVVDGILGPVTFRELLPKTIKTRIGSTNAEIFKRFGKVGQNQTRINLPYPMKLAWDSSKSVSRMTLHRDVAESARHAFYQIDQEYSQEEIEQYGLNLFGGSLNVRRIRGGRRYSTHSWGIAIDIDPARNRLKWRKGKANLASPECAKFLDIWESNGWYSLGREKGFDWMHIQAVKP